MRATLNPIGKKGRMTKTVTIWSNDASAPGREVSIRATVRHGAETVRGLRMERTLFSGTCQRCHADKGRGKSGAALYAAICAFCHGEAGEGRSTHPLKRMDEEATRRWIARGKAGTAMPGYGRAEVGGPLSARQVDSLVPVVRRLAGVR